jgi:hypothetical protein
MSQIGSSPQRHTTWRRTRGIDHCPDLGSAELVDRDFSPGACWNAGRYRHVIEAAQLAEAYERSSERRLCAHQGNLPRRMCDSFPSSLYLFIETILALPPTRPIKHRVIEVTSGRE